jgi:hypothetical protein
MSEPDTTATSAPQKAERKEKKRFQSKSPHAPSANGTTPPRKKKREEQAEAVASELTQLRSTMDELLEHYKLRVGGEIAELSEHFKANNGTQLPSAKVTSAMLQELNDSPFKTRKGRGKDLARLQHLVRRLGELLPPED